jgi:hypothetical protein
MPFHKETIRTLGSSVMAAGDASNVLYLSHAYDVIPVQRLGLSLHLRLQTFGSEIRTERRPRGVAAPCRNIGSAAR